MSFNNTHTPTRPVGKAKWQVPMRPCNKPYRTKTGKVAVQTIPEYYLEGELRDLFCKMFPIHSNRRIMKWFGISFTSLQTFKREMGLEKDMAAIRKELAADVKRICEKNGYYDSIRGKSVSEACLEATRELRAAGFHPIKRLHEQNPRKYKRLMARKSKDRKELIRQERRRVDLGLTPRTKLQPAIIGAVRPFTQTEVSKRYRARKLGYLISSETEYRYYLFYDDETDRHSLFERLCIEAGFKVEECR